MAQAKVREEQQAVELHARWKASQQARAEKLAAMPVDQRNRLVDATSRRKATMQAIAAASVIAALGEVP